MVVGEEVSGVVVAGVLGEEARRRWREARW